jgi:hypothetical protein
MTGTGKDTVGHGAFDVFKECRVASESAHHFAAEENPEKRSPAQGIPMLIIKSFAGFRILRSEDTVHGFGSVNQGQYVFSKAGEIAFELARAADAGFNFRGMGIPKCAGAVTEAFAATLVELLTPGGGAGTDQLERRDPDDGRRRCEVPDRPVERD